MRLRTLLHQQPSPNSMPSPTSETSLNRGTSSAHPQQGTTAVQLPVVQGWPPRSFPQHLLSKLQGWVPVLCWLGHLPLRRHRPCAHDVPTQLLSLRGILYLPMIHLQGWMSYHLQGWPMNPVCCQLSQQGNLLHTKPVPMQALTLLSLQVGSQLLNHLHSLLAYCWVLLASVNCTQ
jgi:hypothetical protein